MGPTYYCDVWTLTSIKKKQNETNKQKKLTTKMVSSFPSQLKGNPCLLGFLESLDAAAWLIGHSSVKKAGDQILFQ